MLSQVYRRLRAGRRDPAASALTRQRSGGSETGAPASAPPPTRRYATARPRTSGGTGRQRDGCDGGVVPPVHTEEVTGSIPVSPTSGKQVRPLVLPGLTHVVERVNLLP